MSITKAIKIAMVNKEINQKDLAKLSGVSETTISQTISGKSSPNTKTLSKLAEAMGFTYSQLMAFGE